MKYISLRERRDQLIASWKLNSQFFLQTYVAFLSLNLMKRFFFAVTRTSGTRDYWLRTGSRNLET